MTHPLFHQEIFLDYVDKCPAPPNRGTVTSRLQAATTRPLTWAIQPLLAESEGERYTGVLYCSALAFALRV